jgi:broad specificity phosphatase PhoE
LLIVLIRHASTEGNDPKKPRVRGWMDNELTPKGRVEAQLAGIKLRKYDLQYLFHSDFMRDNQTSHIIANQLNLSAMESDFDARTWDTGDFSGQPEEDVNPAIIEIYKKPWQSAPGGSESFNGFEQRWFDFLDKKMDFAANVVRPVGITTHGRNIAITESYINDVPPLECQMPLAAGFATISVNPDRSLIMEFPTPTEPVIKDV